MKDRHQRGVSGSSNSDLLPFRGVRDAVQMFEAV